jgi:hypothetical protein
MVPIGFGIPGETQKTFTLVYPNPSNGNIHLLLPETGTSIFTFTIFDMTGKLLQSGTLERAGDKMVYNLDLTQLPKGIYLFKLDGGKSVYENKVIIN